jgi:HD-GYP domain-containing protein (c-di-GMP phosphodiesterase class II)
METPELLQKKFSILQEISSAVVVADSISALANLMLDLAVNYSNAEKGSLMLVNERDELYIYILSARGIDPQLVRSYKVKVGEGIAGTVAQDRQAVLVDDIEKDGKFKGKTRDHYKTKSFISCPIINKDRLFGVLNINDKKDDTPFTGDEFSLIKIISDHAAIALENAFLMDQLKAKAAELEEINKKLIETDVIKTESLTHISHELRTPLNSIKGAIHYLRQSKKPTQGEQREFHDIINDETNKLVSIVENMLDFLRHEDEARIIKKSLVNLSDLLEEISGSKTMKTLLTGKSLNLEIDIKEGLPDIVADKTRVGQLFINLIEGLSRHLEEDDTMRITVNENSSVEVSLTLPRKMPDYMLPYLFSSGQVLQTDQPEEGLKLCLARKVVESHRWDLDAKNTGDNFLITIAIPKSKRERIDAIATTAMEMFLEFISDLLDLNTCSIMLYDDLSGELTIKSARGLPEDVIKRTRIRFGDRIAGWVAHEGKPLLIGDIEDDQHFGRKSFPRYNTKSLLSLPLKVQNKVVGVLNLNNKKIAGPFTMRDLYIASVISERVSYFIEGLYSGEHGEHDFKQFITSFGNFLDAEKRYHKKNVHFPDLMLMLMDKLGAEEEDKKLALYVSMIYDLGLVSVEKSVLKKKKLLPSEARVLNVHPYTAVSLLGDFEFSEDVRGAILHHHERYDGTGYPDRLKGEGIPFISRVLSVVDTFHAMTANRPYSRRFTKAEAFQEIKRGSGSAYDPSVVEALEEVLDLL